MKPRHLIAEWVMLSAIVVLVALAMGACNMVLAGERVVFSFTGKDCSWCAKLETSWADPQVQAELISAKARREKVDVDKLTPEARKSLRLNIIPLTVVADVEGEKTTVLRRHVGYMTADKLRGFLRGDK